MVGKHATIWAYARGYMARDLPYQLWWMIEQAEDWHKLFWEDDAKDTPISKFGDLTHWMAYMADKIWLIITDNATSQIAGIGWFSDHRSDTALTSIWIAPLWRGKWLAREAIELGCEFGYVELGLKTIQTITPWPLARNLAQRAGFRTVCRIPKHCGLPQDVWLLEHVRKGEGTSLPHNPTPSTWGAGEGREGT